MKPLPIPIDLKNREQYNYLHFSLFVIKSIRNDPRMNKMYDDDQFKKQYAANFKKGVFEQAEKDLLVFFQKSVLRGVPVTGQPDERTLLAINNIIIEVNEGTEREFKNFFIRYTGDDGGGSNNNGNGHHEEEGATYTVTGFVFDAAGKRVNHQMVEAYDIDLSGAGIYKNAKTKTDLLAKGGLQFLGGGVSEIEGFYSISFKESKFKSGESVSDETPDVVVFAMDGDIILGRSALSRKNDFINNQLQRWNINFSKDVLKRSSTEFLLVSTAIEQMLSAQENKMEAWQMKGNNDMLQFLSDEINIEIAKTTIYVNADFLIHDAAVKELPAFLRDANAKELLYGLGRQTVKLEWTALSKTSITSLAAYIMRSSVTNIIFSVGGIAATTFGEALHGFAIKQALTQNTKLKNILSIAIKNDALIEKFHSLYINRKGTPEEFWKELEKDNDLKGNVKALLLTNQLSSLTGNHAPVIARLMPHATGNDATKLIELSEEKWNEAIANDIPDFIMGDTDAEKKTKYREYMRSLLHGAFPNEKVSLMVKNEDEIKIQDKTIRDKLNKFLTSTEFKFDLRINRLHDKISPDSEVTFKSKLDEIGGEQKVKLQLELNKVQRVFQFSPSPEVMTKMLDKGISSATMVASMPFNSFKSRYSDVGDEAILLAIHQRASHIVSMIEYSILSLNRFSQTANVPAITGEKKLINA